MLVVSYAVVLMMTCSFILLCGYIHDNVNKNSSQQDDG